MRKTMTRKTCVDKNGMKKGAWSEEEDDKLRSYILRYGHWNWRLLPKFAGLARCGKSCRLRWMNYLKPGLKRGCFTKEEEHLIAKLHDELGKKWSAIAARIPGRSDNEIKNFWHTHLKKRSSKTNTTTTIMPSSSEITVCKNNASNSDEGRGEFSENFHQIETTSDKHMIQLGSSGTLKTPNPGGVIWDSEDTASSSSHSAGRQVEETHHLFSQEQVIAQNFDSQSLIDGITLSDGFEANFWTEPFIVDMTSYSHDHSFSPLMLMLMEEQLNKTHQFTLPWM